MGCSAPTSTEEKELKHPDTICFRGSISCPLASEIQTGQLDVASAHLYQHLPQDASSSQAPPSPGCSKPLAAKSSCLFELSSMCNFMLKFCGSSLCSTSWLQDHSSGLKFDNWFATSQESKQRFHAYCRNFDKTADPKRIAVTRLDKLCRGNGTN